MKIKLNVMERLLMGTQMVALFPEQGSILKLQMKKDILEKVAIKGKDITKYEIKEVVDGANKGNLQWNTLGAKGVNFEFDKAEMDYLQEVIKASDKQEAIPESVFELCVRILDLKEDEKTDKK